MKRDKDNQTLTRVEMEIMNRLWAMNEPSVSVRQLLAEYPEPKACLYHSRHIYEDSHGERVCEA